MRYTSRVGPSFTRTINAPDLDYRNYREKVTQENCRFFADLHNSTTPAQRLNFVKLMKDYATDARTLMVPGR